MFKTVMVFARGGDLPHRSRIRSLFSILKKSRIEGGVVNYLGGGELVVSWKSIGLGRNDQG